jgi:arsenate reductase (glutaredoxin)
MKRIYHLSTCSTCQKIIKALNLPAEIELIDIKTNSIEEEILDFLKDKMGSYEALFSKKAMKYRSLGLHEQVLTETDFKSWMLKEYTFLKRPFILYGDTVFVGNSKNTVESAQHFFNSL